MEFHELMDSFAQSATINKFEPNDENVYHCEIDGMVVEFSEFDDDRMLLSSTVCKLPEIGSASFYEVMMDAMFMGQATAGAFFAINPSGEIVIQSIVSSFSIDLDEFKKILEDYVNILETWRGIANELMSMTEEALKAKVQENDQFNLGVGDFMRV